MTSPASETRQSIYDCVHENPGIHFNGISRKLDIATGQTQYHLRKLLRGEAVIDESICGRTHYYPPTYSAWERKAIALLRRETTREIISSLLRRDETRPATIANHLDLARSTVEWHLSNLIEHNLAEKRHVEDGVVVELTEPQEMYQLLREIEPHAADRLIDRFSRLADELLGD